jgi:hypothetical protein
VPNVITYPNYRGFRNLRPGDLRYFTARMLAEGFDPRAVAEVIEYESASTWSPSVGAKGIKHNKGRLENGRLRGPVGLLQFTRSKGGGAQAVGKTIEQLADMTFREQLESVVSYFKHYALSALNAQNGMNNYHLAGWGDNVGGSPDYVLTDKDGARASLYAPNAQIDEYPPFGVITARELEQSTKKNTLAGVSGTVTIDLSLPMTHAETLTEASEALPSWASAWVGMEYWFAVKGAQ